MRRRRRRRRGRGRGSLAGRSAMTGTTRRTAPRGHPRGPADVRRVRADGRACPAPSATTSSRTCRRRPGRGPRRSPSPSTGIVRLTRTNRGLVVDAKLRTAMAGECARCLRPRRDAGRGCGSTRRSCPSIDLASGAARPARGGRATRRRRASPTTTSWSCGRSSPRRSASRSRSRPCASRTARACAPSAASAWRPGTATTTCPSTRGWRRSGPSGSTPGTRAGRLPVRPHVLRRRVCAPARPVPDDDHETVSRARPRHQPRKEQEPTWVCRSERSLTRDRWSAGATSPSPCRRSSSARTATSRSCRTGSARRAGGTTAARRSQLKPAGGSSAGEESA